MAPVVANAQAHLEPLQLFNPFYSPSIGDDGDQTYAHAQFKVSLCATYQLYLIEHQSAILS